MRPATVFACFLPAVLAQSGTMTVTSTMLNPVTVTSTMSSTDASSMTGGPESIRFNTTGVTGSMTAFNSTTTDSPVSSLPTVDPSASSLAGSAVSSLSSSASAAASSATSAAAAAAGPSGFVALLPNAGLLAVAAVALL